MLAKQTIKGTKGNQLKSAKYADERWSVTPRVEHTIALTAIIRMNNQIADTLEHMHD